MTLVTQTQPENPKSKSLTTKTDRARPDRESRWRLSAVVQPPRFVPVQVSPRTKRMFTLSDVTTYGTCAGSLAAFYLYLITLAGKSFEEGMTRAQSATLIGAQPIAATLLIMMLAVACICITARRNWQELWWLGGLLLANLFGGAVVMWLGTMALSFGGWIDGRPLNSLGELFAHVLSGGALIGLGWATVASNREGFNELVKVEKERQHGIWVNKIWEPEKQDAIARQAMQTRTEQAPQTVAPPIIEPRRTIPRDLLD